MGKNRECSRDSLEPHSFSSVKWAWSGSALGICGLCGEKGSTPAFTFCWRYLKIHYSFILEPVFWKWSPMRQSRVGMSKIKGRFYILVPLWGQLLLFEQGALHLKKNIFIYCSGYFGTWVFSLCCYVRTSLLHGMWDLSFPTRGQTCVLCIESQILNH